MKRHTVGFYPYINAKPLTDWLEQHQAAHEIEIIKDVPSRLPRLLDESKAEVILTSSIDAITKQDRLILPIASVSSYSQVMSVKLFSKVPIESISKLALGTHSLTSNALAQILLAEIYCCKPQIYSFSPDLDQMLEFCDAAVIIGDPCLKIIRRDLITLDLGELWSKHTRLPFVWALWICKDQPPSSDLIEKLIYSKQWGLKHINEIITDTFQMMSWNSEQAQHYFSECLNYEFTNQHLESLLLFKKKIQEHSLADKSYFPRVAELSCEELSV
jgi:chorismate dehydratase